MVPNELERSSFVKRVRYFEKLALDDNAYSFRYLKKIIII